MITFQTNEILDITIENVENNNQILISSNHSNNLPLISYESPEVNFTMATYMKVQNRKQNRDKSEAKALRYAKDVRKHIKSQIETRNNREQKRQVINRIEFI